MGVLPDGICIYIYTCVYMRESVGEGTKVDF